MRYIDADKMREEWLEGGENEYVYDTNSILDSIDEQPTADVVSTKAFEQVKWERDMAIAQLKSYGVELCENKELVEVKYGEWKEVCFGEFHVCSICGYSVDYKLTNYCPDCGADMRGAKE